MRIHAERFKALQSRAMRTVGEMHERWLSSRFESKFGIDTDGIDHDLAALGGSGEPLRHATGYEPIQHTKFRAMIRAADIEPARYTFVDYGSGKGRALLLAAEFNFHRVIGIEFASTLHEAASRNIAAYSRKRPHRPIENLCQDAGSFPIPEGNAFLYFYNPFGPAVLRKITDMIAMREPGPGRDLIVAYRNPVHAEVFDELRCLRTIARNPSFVLYQRIGQREAST